ncbi:clathrin coat assembly protein AP180 [Silene latifolia]|uniref:clathrin coat assembly protein AP180 n=1 Tax=Silene latifolia TaxID=37657 RepID=UPI003D784BF1
MPSKFKKAIAVVKDQTSISLAKVGGADSSSLEVAILRATTHDEVPVDERHVMEVLQHVSSNRSYARSCARALGRRIGRTKNWVVAVKSLMLVLRLFQDGDPHFPKEVLHAMKRGYKILNITSFRDESNTSCPWDFTAFVRTFALYLDERLDCFLTGKLQRRTSHYQSGKTRGYPRRNLPFVRDMKPNVLLDRITHWQRLLDRAIASQPTGIARTNRLVKTCLYAIVQESFELYRDISDGLALLIDGFFHLQYNNCVSVYQTCAKASKQFEELGLFHNVCKAIGLGRSAEYPSVHKISDELIETLQEFLKDQSSFPGSNGVVPGISTSLPPPSPREFDPRSITRSDLGSRDRAVSEYGGSQCTSLEDLISTDPGFSPDRYSDPGRENSPQGEDIFEENDSASVRSDPTDHRGINSVLDLLSLDGPSPPPEFQDSGFEPNENEGWELVLFDTSDQHPSETNNHNYDNSTNNDVDFFSSFNANGVNPSTSNSPLSLENNYSNPFLEDTMDDLNGIIGADPLTDNDLFGSFAQTGFDSHFPEGGFPGDLSHTSFQPEFNDNASGGFSTDKGIAPQTFKAEFGDDFCNVNASNLDFPSISSGFPTDKGIAPQTFKAEFGDDFCTVNASNLDFPSISGGFPTDKGIAPQTFKAEFGDDFPPNFFTDSKANINRQVSHQSLPVDLFGDFGNATNSFGHSTSFSADLGDGNAIVPFNPADSDDLFSSGPRFQAAPTFRANSIDMDEQNSSFGIENDPFGSITNTTAVETQQQLWLQNQNKILARHLT